MKKEYIKPIIINIKICNDDALLLSGSLYEINNDDSVDHIADEDDEPTPDGDGIIWND